jgi:hypothetical protein
MKYILIMWLYTSGIVIELPIKFDSMDTCVKAMYSMKMSVPTAYNCRKEDFNGV